MSNLNNIVYVIIFLGIGVLINRWETKNIVKKEETDNDRVREFILNKKQSDDVKLFTKPFIWIHLDTAINSRNWESFNSRSSNEVNKPYITYCIDTIVSKCGNEFNVCLIDDESFSKLLVNWNIDLSRIDDVNKEKLRLLAISKILYNYGGMIVPSSFICLKSLKSLYYKNVNTTGMLTCETLDKTAYVTQSTHIPDVNFLGCKKRAPVMKEYSEWLEKAISTDYSSEMVFNNTPAKYLNEKVKERKITLVDGKNIGIKDESNNNVVIEDLFNTKYIQFIDGLTGINVPDKEISLRHSYSWINKVSIQDLLNSDLLISKYLLLTNDATV